MGKEYVPIFFDWLETTQDLNPEEKGNLIDAVVSYASGQEYEHLLTGGCKIAFRFLKGQVDRNAAISEARSRAGSSKKEQEETNDNKEEQRETKPTREVKRFVPPTLEEVTQYCKERNNGIDPAYFMDYQTARNWVLSNGKKAQDWKAVIRTWEKNNYNKGSSTKPVKTVSAQQYSQRDYSTDADFKEWEERNQRELEEAIERMKQKGAAS